MEMIREMTADCGRDDCAIVERHSYTTLLAWSATYDKHGNRTDRGDPNTTTREFHCRTCDRMWVTRTQYGDTSVTLVSPLDLPK